MSKDALMEAMTTAGCVLNVMDHIPTDKCFLCGERENLQEDKGFMICHTCWKEEYAE